MSWTRGLLPLVVGVMWLGLAGAAHATPPQTTRFTQSGSQPWTSCPGFDITVNFSVDIVDTLFFDASGNVVREQVHFFGTGELVNSVTGQTNTGSGPTMDILNYRRGTAMEVGLGFHNTMPGAGIVALSAGNIRFTIDATGNLVGPTLVAGPHPAFDDIDWCSLVS